MNYADPAYCERHDRELADKLPPFGCPLNDADPLKVCREWADAGHKLLDLHFWSQAGKFLDASIVCNRCLTTGILFKEPVRSIRQARGHAIND